MGFANAACNQLGVLRPEVEDQNSIVPEFHAVRFQLSAFSHQQPTREDNRTGACDKIGTEVGMIRVLLKADG